MRPDLWAKKTGKRRGKRATRCLGERGSDSADTRRRRTLVGKDEKRSHEHDEKETTLPHTHASMPLANALSASRADLNSLAPDVVQRYDAGDEDVAFDVLFW